MHRAGCVRRPAAHRTNPSKSPITPQAERHNSSWERRPMATSTILVSRLFLHESAQVNQYAAQGEKSEAFEHDRDDIEVKRHRAHASSCRPPPCAAWRLTPHW